MVKSTWSGEPGTPQKNWVSSADDFRSEASRPYSASMVMVAPVSRGAVCSIVLAMGAAKRRGLVYKMGVAIQKIFVLTLEIATPGPAAAFPLWTADARVFP